MFKDKKILLGITGSIAAYKSILLLRGLIKAGATVKVVMTPAARDFVSPLTLSTLSGHPVQYDLFTEGTWANHVMLGRWADCMLIAPMTCQTLSKMAHGQCDNLLLATYYSSTCPVCVAPAMDEEMWLHPATQANMALLQSRGVVFLPVETGALASGLEGAGRMAEPESIMEFLEGFFPAEADLKGKTVLVTAGPTFEPIDPVRFIGNRSTGKMGIAIALQCARRGAKVHLVLGPTSITVTHNSISVHRVQTAAEMLQVCVNLFPAADLTFMAAAIADYAPAAYSGEKIKKSDAVVSLELNKTPDVLKELAAIKRPGQFLVGFALETMNARENALKKLKDKKVDLIVLNSLADEGAGFGYDTNKVTIFAKDGSVWDYTLKSKQQVAGDIVDKAIKQMYV